MIDKTENDYLTVTYLGKPAKMLNIFGEVLLELETGEKMVVSETLLDRDWRQSGDTT